MRHIHNMPLLKLVHLSLPPLTAVSRSLSLPCYQVVKEDTIVVIEYPVEMKALPHILGDNRLFGLRNRRFGRTVIGIYVCSPTRRYDMRPEDFGTT